MEIDMLSSSYLQFEKGFNRLYRGIEPLYSVVTSINRLMASNDELHFVLPGSKSRDKQNHIFYFEKGKKGLEFSRME